MKHQTIALLIFFAFFSSAAAQQVAVERNVEQSGDDLYTVQVTIHKSDLGCFAQFRQELPENTSIEPQQYSGSELRREGNEAIFTWMRLPLQNPVKLRYNLITEKSMNETVTSEFNYQVKNYLGKVVLDPLTLSGSMAQAALEKEAKTQSGSGLSGKRIMKKSGDQVQVAVNIRVPENTITLKLTEVIPDAYAASPLSLNGASYGMNRGEMTMTWDNIPSSGKLKAVYVLKSEANRSAYPEITGTVTANTAAGDKSAAITTSYDEMKKEDKERLQDAKNLWGD